MIDIIVLYADLGEADACRFLVVDVADVDRRVLVDGRAGDERVQLWDEDDLIDSVYVHRAQFVCTDPTRRAAAQLTECHCTTILVRYSL